MPILWSGVARNDVLLAQCGVRDERNAVDKLAKAIVSKKPTAGWEFSSSGGLKAVKLHVHETRDLVWSMACVHDHDENVAKGFLEKLILMTEPLRPEWRLGGHLSAQAGVGLMLQQRMDQANSMGRLAMVTDKVNEVKGLMSDNIDVLLQNQVKVEHLENESAALMEQASTFKKATTSIKKHYLWMNAKYGAAAGTAVTAGVAVVTVPPLAAAAGTGVGFGVGLGVAATAGIATGVATTISRDKKAKGEGGGGESSSVGAAFRRGVGL